MAYVQVERPTVEHARKVLCEKYPGARIYAAKAHDRWQGRPGWDVAVSGVMRLDRTIYAWQFRRSVNHWNLNRIYIDKIETLE